jgi:uncharacterized protein (TIGR02594 family)
MSMPPRFAEVPPAEDFQPGRRNPAFTAMGRRFRRWLGPEISHDGDGYQPGPEFSTFDRDNVKFCQGVMKAETTGVLNQAQWTTLMTTDPVRDYKVTAFSLNVRSATRIDAAVVGHLHKDEVAKVSGTSRDKYWMKVSTDSVEGWASHKFLAKVPLGGARNPRNAPWLAIAKAEVGTKEQVGSGDNPRVVQYLSSTSLSRSLAANDETAWCSAFVNFVVEKAGFEGTDSAAARSWANWGVPVDNPQPGAITVFERPEAGPTAGHVGFFVSQTQSTIMVLGGNQSDAVSIQPQERSRLLGFRMPG